MTARTVLESGVSPIPPDAEAQKVALEKSRARRESNAEQVRLYQDNEALRKQAALEAVMQGLVCQEGIEEEVHGHGHGDPEWDIDEDEDIDEESFWGLGWF